MDDEKNRGELYAALAQVQAELATVGKDGTNPHFRSSYATLAGLRRAVNPVLAKHGLCCYHLAGADSVRTVLGHTGGASIETETPIINTKGDSQGYGSALTYACRYALQGVVGVAPADEDDGNAAIAPPARQQQAPRLAPAPATPPAPAEPAPVTIYTPPAAERKRLHALGHEVYGPAGWAGKRAELSSAISHGRTESSSKLTADEWRTLFDGVKAKADSVSAARDKAMFPNGNLSRD